MPQAGEAHVTFSSRGSTLTAGLTWSRPKPKLYGSLLPGGSTVLAEF